MKLKKFYVVWRGDNRGSNYFDDHEPTVRHSSHETAVTEARRLAALHAGAEFFVLVTTVRVAKDDIRVDTLS